MDLEYNIAYHLRCQLLLGSGRTIKLESLDQQMTYAGLIVGTPDAASNDHAVEYAQREAERHCVLGAKPHVIQPPRRNYLRQAGDMQRVKNAPRGAPEWLPMVRCIGSFKDAVPARDPVRHLSVLVAVWFQDEYALPILEPAASQLRALNWEALATDIDL